MHQFPAVISAINAVIETSVFVDGLGVSKTSADFDDDCYLIGMDATRADVASVSSGYDPVYFVISWITTLLCPSSPQQWAAEQASSRTLTLLLIFKMILNLILMLSVWESVVQ